MDENKDLNKETEAYDKASFADVNYDITEVKEEKVKKEYKNKSRLYGILIGVALALVLVAAFTLFKGEKTEVGLSNRFNSPIGVIDGNYLYHSDIEGTKFIKTNIKTGEMEVLAEKSVAFFSKYKGDIYYYDSLAEQILRYNKKGEDVVIYEGSAYYQQFKDGYIYFLEPNSNYGGIIKRVSVKGGEAEVVLSAPSSHFALEGKNIIYYDPTINSLLINKIKDTMENTEAKTSAELMSVVLNEGYAMNINVVGKDIYYTDPKAQYKIQKLDMSKGEVTGINFDTLGAQVNVYEDYLFYINPNDKHIYRTDLDGSDIRDITGSAFQETMGLSVFEDRILFYALVGVTDDNMQTQSYPFIVLMDFEGNYLCRFNPNENLSFVPDVSLEEETEMSEEAFEENMEIEEQAS